MKGISVHGSKKAPTLVSTNGKKLLTELTTPKADLEVTLSYINCDPIAGRLKDLTTGNTAYHLLVSGDHPVSFVLPVLQLLLEKCPDGVKVLNNDGSCPLHVSLAQYDIVNEIVLILLQAFPGAAGIVNNQGLTPLFYCVMRDNPSVQLVREMCRAYPLGPSTKNLTNSMPLHFACKRNRPSREVLTILLKRYPDAAKQCNDFGLLPLHIITSATDDVVAVDMIYQAHPEAIQQPDRQGRTCLHLAVLAVGREHEAAISREESHWCNDYAPADIGTSNRGKDTAATANTTSGTKSGSASANNDTDDDDDDEEESAYQGGGRNELVERDGSRSRKIIQFLITHFPKALVTNNNFMATPVQTVLEKVKRIKSKNHKVALFGLFDDPPSSRLLLTSHFYRFNHGLLPPMRTSHMEAMRYVNVIITVPSHLS